MLMYELWDSVYKEIAEVRYYGHGDWALEADSVCRTETTWEALMEYAIRIGFDRLA